MTGWLNLPEEYDKDEFARIQKAAAKIQSDSESVNRHRYWRILFRGTCSD